MNTDATIKYYLKRLCYWLSPRRKSQTDWWIIKNIIKKLRIL